MEIEDIFDELRSRAPSASRVPYRWVSFRNGDEPLAHQCHQNVARWISENPDCTAVRGWLLTSGHLADKHTLVRSGDGAFFDITPLDVPTPFLEHPGEEIEFHALGNQLHLVVVPALNHTSFELSDLADFSAR